MNQPPPSDRPIRPRVVVIGGGFAGLNAVQGLSGRPVDVTLIDRKNHHTFQPLLYQVASGVLSPGQISAPLRRVLRAKNVEVLLGEVARVDTNDRIVQIDDGPSLGYDYLVVAAGARHDYFGHDDWAADAPGLKTIEDALEMRRRILGTFESAEREAFTTGTPPPLNFAVVGAGPTGVELAGALADIARRVVARDYKHIDTTQAKILLFEGADRVLGMYPPDLSAKAKRQLEELGVDVRLSSLVTDIQQDRIQVAGEWIPVRVTLWATGVAASPLGRFLADDRDRAGRVRVAPDLSVPGLPEVFVIGDMASLKDARGVVVPGLGAAATQMGRAAAANILRDLGNEPRKPFTYRDKGTMATIGRNRAVALVGKIRLSGLIAWLGWAFVHLMLLVGFANRLRVMTEWVWAYFSSERGARLITDARDRDSAASNNRHLSA